MFFGSTEALHALLRDTSRVAIIAVGMTFVIVLPLRGDLAYKHCPTRACPTQHSLAALRPSSFGGWEVGLLVLLALLYLGGAFVNPVFFGSTEAFHALLRDTSRVAIMAVGMTFVIVNKDLDLSVGSTYGLVAVVFARLFAPNFLDLGVVTSVIVCLLLGA